MMVDRFTPGPWAVGPAPYGHCRIYAPTSGEGHAIARTYGDDLNGIGVCRLTGPENAADAILIAAAPTMLAALRRVATAVPHALRDHPDRLVDVQRALGQVHQAIAIATSNPKRIDK